ncbi:glycosyltransferase [Rhodanobacter sp. Col0626]|uniref:glycosyltransferase n=1 Tax=Rhodanobacter sp. Col0626 TaxID=3415679 RepID=UPI003CF05499
MSNDTALVLVPSDRMGGAERILRMVTNELLARGWMVDVVCLSRGTGALFSDMHGADPKCAIYILSDTREIFGVIRALLLFASLLRRRAYTLAFSSLTHCNAFAGFLRMLRLMRTRRLVCRESTIISRRFHGLRRVYYWSCYLFYRSVDKVVCQTNEMAAELLKFTAAVKASNVTVLANPIAPISGSRSARAMSENPLFVSVGRLIPEKGFDVLIEAFAQLLPQWPKAQLYIYGEGPEREELKALVARLEISDNILLCGMTKMPHDVMRSADVCVISSIAEGFPNVLLEMMRANSRVVATHCADGVSDIEGLITCPTRDPAALADALRTAITISIDDVGEKFDAELGRRTPTSFVNALLSY